MTASPDPTPIVCDMTTASDTPQERIAEYGRLFEHALTGTERTTNAIVWRFADRAGVEAWVRDLAAREAACCPFLHYTVTAIDGEVVYEIAGGDDPMIQAILDELHQLPDRVSDGLGGLLNQMKSLGLDVETSAGGIVMTPATSATRDANAA